MKWWWLGGTVVLGVLVCAVLVGLGVAASGRGSSQALERGPHESARRALGPHLAVVPHRQPWPAVWQPVIRGWDWPRHDLVVIRDYHHEHGPYVYRVRVSSKGTFRHTAPVTTCDGSRAVVEDRTGNRRALRLSGGPCSY